MNNNLQAIGFIALILAILGFSIWLGIYNYHDCLNVGHSKFYCVMHFGK